MTRTILVAAAVALAACASAQDDKRAPAPAPGGAAPTFDPRNPKVFVVTGAPDCKDRKAAIVVDQEPVYFFLRQNGQPFTITWHLQTRGYSFVPQFTIADPTPVDRKYAAGEITNCQAGGQTMKCTNKNQTKGYWKYTLRIRADQKCGEEPEDLDPVIGND